MKLLVVTPTLGESQWVEETISSVRKHAPTAIHLLVAPSNKIEKLRSRFPHLKFAPDTGGGMYAAINAGASATENWDAITYINDDDVLLPDFRRLVAKAMNCANKPSLVYGQVQLIGSTSRRIGRIPISPIPQFNRLLYANQIEPVFQHGTVLSRPAWDQLGGFDPSFRLCGDSDLLARACIQGIPAIHVWKEVAAFRLHAGQLTKSKPAMHLERVRVNEKLQLLSAKPTWKHRMVRIVFRLCNAPVYVDRILRHGWARFEEVVAKEV